MKQAPPLTGIRILDLSRIIAGPNCTMQLADLGAEVIKVERPGHGDETRNMRPPDANGEAHFYLAYNRNKKSIAINMQSETGRELIHQLAAKSDVMIENFRPGVVKRLGIDYEAMKQINPGLVYCSISAYGQSGAMAKRPGLDPVLQAEMGLMSVNGDPEGTPMRHLISLTDLMTSLLASTAISAALVRRKDTGLGEFIDLSLMGGAFALLGNVAQYYLTSGENPPRTGNAHPSAVPVGAFAGSDGEMFYMACGTQGHYIKLVESIIEQPELVEDRRFATNKDRVENRQALLDILAKVFAAQPRDYWVEQIQAAGLPAGPVRTLSEAMESPEVINSGLLQTLNHPTAGDIRLMRSPIKLANTEDKPDSPPPLLGQHTDEVLRDVLDADDETLANLRSAGVID
ncbi:MAG: CoA transferase [Hyphomicrobiaceae bacterium TMED74]|nr:CoA transferase [Filomicrobium sp.]RPG41990.1 MAG: CoA transferase [Hyphomicrobiaceae bacterium TMED74]